MADEAVERLQASWRGKVIRRDLKRRNLYARRVQSLYRGYHARKGFSVKLKELARLEAEEKRRQERQRRILMNQR